MGWLSTTIGDGVGIASDDLFAAALHAFCAALPLLFLLHSSLYYSFFFKLCVYVVDYRHH